MTITAKRFKPEAIVKVYTEKGDLVVRSKPKSEESAIDAEVLSISTTNDLGVDAGVFTVTLVTRNRWDKTIASNDLVVIYMKRNPNDDEKKSAVFFGLVDHVRYHSSIQNGQVQQQVTITGRSFAKALINFEIGVVETTEEVIGESTGWLRSRGITFMGQNAAQNVQQLFDRLVKVYVNYTFSNKKTLMDLLKLQLSSRETIMMSEEQTLLSYQGSMWNLFKELIDEPFNQMYFEVIDGEPTFILRETPFNPDKWKHLQPRTVTDEEIVDIDIGRNDLETYTLYSVGVTNMFGTFSSQGTLGLRPLVYEPYLKKYGIRRLHRYTNYIGKALFNEHPKQKQKQSSDNQSDQPTPSRIKPVAYTTNDQQQDTAQSSQSGDEIEVLKQYMIDLYNWNVMNPDFYSGYILVRGDNRFKVGDRLFVITSEIDENGKRTKREFEFFIEGVEHEFVNFSHWYTRLSVTRGLPDRGKGRFEKPWGAYKEYQGGGAGDPTVEELAMLKEGTSKVFSWFQAGVSTWANIGDSQKVAQYYLYSGTFTPHHNFGENRGDHIHKGEDLSAKEGTRIYALFDGKVIRKGYQAGGAGYYIVLQHANGVVTKYFHMKSPSHLPVGAVVKAGDLIGYVGATGRAKGAHLHLEIWENGVAKNPIPILKKLAGTETEMPPPKPSKIRPVSTNDWWKGGGNWA